MFEILKILNFLFIKVNESIFYNNKINIIIVAHINNLLFFGKNIKDINLLKLNLLKVIEISDLRNIKYYLNIKITRNKPKNKLFKPNKIY